MSEWQSKKLGDFIKVKHGYAFKGKNITDEETDAILVTPGNFKIGGGFKSSKFKYFNSEYPKEYVLSDGDIVVTMTDLSKESDTLGYSAKIPSVKGKVLLHNQRIGLVEFTDNEVSKEFIYWLMRTSEYQWYCVSSASGTSIMHTSPSRIEDYDFKLPNLSEQRAIASVLSSLDDKIDLLHRQNQTLEQMAETLFRQWFQPPQKLRSAGVEEADEGWEEGVLGDLIEVKYGKDHKKLSDGLIPVYGSGGFMRAVERPIYEGESVLIPRKGTLNNVMYVNEAFWTVDTMFYTIMKRDHLAKFVYQFIKQKDLASMNVGSAVPSMTTTVLNNMPIEIPPDDLLDRFDKIVSEFYSKIKSNQTQIRTLTALRDTLLPKLMSGEVRVKN